MFLINQHNIIFLSAIIFIVAILYSSIGHGGASGYLAAMVLADFAPEVMKPTVLYLNILVASIAAIRFYRADCFSPTIFLPFAIASIPFAFLGGALSLPGAVYKQVVGIILLFAAFQFFRYSRQRSTIVPEPLPILPAIIFGAGIGFLSGLTGVGGGIFLTPLLIFMNWAEPRQAAGVSAVFIIVNSIAGLLGHFSNVSLTLTLDAIPFLVPMAIAGGIIGSGFGARKFSDITLRQLLAMILVIAGLKFMFV